MKRLIITSLIVFAALPLVAQEYNTIPSDWKWTDNDVVVFSNSGRYSGGEDSFAVKAKTWERTDGVKADGRFSKMPIKVDGAKNMTYSPDSTRIAYTLDGNLYIHDIDGDRCFRLTYDGSDVILNGSASWVYYEEIFGRSSNYRAFWWSPDGKKIAYYRFDDSEVPMFPIYSPHGGQDGTLRETHYPKAGEKNPEVRIGFIDVDAVLSGADPVTVWADFDPAEDGYFGTPFWSRDSRVFYVAREPRIQNTLDLYAVAANDGSKEHVYHETYATWLDWIDRMLFTDEGFYMVRSFETGWQQIYFLSYDGKTFRRLTDGTNWDISLQKVLPDGSVAFLAKRDSQVRYAVYKVDRKGRITPLTDTSYDVAKVRFSPDGKYFAASISNLQTPTQIWVYTTAKPSKCFKVADMRGPEYFDGLDPVSEIVWMENDGLQLPATVVYPYGFDPSKKYPVHVDIYGGPDSPLVRDRYERYENNFFYASNDIIQVTADCRASGHNGREGLDQIYKHLSTVEVDDFIAWARYFQSLPYVIPEKIGVEGFSFGGTMTAKLLLTAPDAYHYGIAGGGVYDWMLYDTHYTERFMSTPEDNPEGYAVTVMDLAAGYPTDYYMYDLYTGQAPQPIDSEFATVEPVMLKITHGTGDDNVHFQNTLLLIDALQTAGKKFEFMIYPDGMHGYRGTQGLHFYTANYDFWLKYLKN